MTPRTAPAFAAAVLFAVGAVQTEPAAAAPAGSRPPTSQAATSQAATSRAPASQSPVWNPAGRQTLLDDIASQTEDLVDDALAPSPAKAAAALEKIARLLPELRPMIDARVFDTLVSERLALDQAMTRGGGVDLALGATQMYRTLQEAMEPARRATPLPIALLDYSGFRLLALSRSSAPDWSAMAAAAKEMSGFWGQVAPKVSSKPLGDLMKTIESGLSDAITRKDPAYLAFAARTLLDSVDLLEAATK